MAPTLVREPFRQPGWIYEENVDGYRIAGVPERQAYSAGEPRVMVADNEPHFRQVLHELLSSEGYEVVVFATGAQLLEAVPTFHPDVIVVDMMMPGLSGTDVLAALRRAGLALPVILISGHPITEPEGVFAFIT